jgi:Domain of unknown function (DUF1966)
VLYSDRSTLVMRKGEVLSAFSNRGEATGSSFSVRVAVGWVAGEVLVEVLGCGIAVVDGGGLNVIVNSGLPAVSMGYDRCLINQTIFTPLFPLISSL